MAKYLLSAFSGILFACMAGSGQVQAQLLDTTFANSGYPQQSLLYGTATGSVVQPDGKIVVSIEDPGLTANTNYYYINTCRYNPDGSRDLTYGNNGKSETWVGSKSLNKSIALQPDGKIVYIGQAAYCVDLVCGLDNIIIGRLKTNGVADSTFGINGIVRANYLFGPLVRGSHGRKMKVTPDGKMIVSGTVSMENGTSISDNYVFVSRLNADGTYDNSFGNNGIMLFGNNYYKEVQDMKLDQQGNIYLTGPAHQSFHVSDGYIIKLDPNGNPYPGFGSNGHAFIDFGNMDIPKALYPQTDGKIALAGHTRYNLDSACVAFITVLEPNGQVSNQFGQPYVRLNLPKPDSQIGSILVQPGNRIVFTGTMANLSYQTGASFYSRRYIEGFVGRLMPNGMPDNSFSGTGNAITYYSMGEMNPNYNSGTTLLSSEILPDGKLLISGGRNYLLTSTRQAVLLMRLNTPQLVGVSNSVQAPAFSASLSPNPASGSTVLRYPLQQPEQVSIWLTDLAGRSIHQFCRQQMRTADEQTEVLQIPAEIAGGIYLLHVQSASGKYAVQRVVVQH